MSNFIDDFLIIDLYDYSGKLVDSNSDGLFYYTNIQLGSIIQHNIEKIIQKNLNEVHIVYKEYNFKLFILIMCLLQLGIKISFHDNYKFKFVQSNTDINDNNTININDFINIKIINEDQCLKLKLSLDLFESFDHKIDVFNNRYPTLNLGLCLRLGFDLEFIFTIKAILENKEFYFFNPTILTVQSIKKIIQKLKINTIITNINSFVDFDLINIDIKYIFIDLFFNYHFYMHLIEENIEFKILLLRFDKLTSVFIENKEFYFRNLEGYDEIVFKDMKFEGFKNLGNSIKWESHINKLEIVKNSIILKPRSNYCVFIELEYKTATIPINKLIDNVLSHIKEYNTNFERCDKINENLIYILPLNSPQKIPINKYYELDREKMMELFAKEIEDLYEEYYDNENEDDDFESIISQILFGIINIEVDTDLNYFDFGLTSLNVISFKCQLNKRLDLKLSLKDIYENNSISKLVNLVNRKDDGNPIIYYQTQIDEYFDFYTQNPKFNQINDVILGNVCILTGSTGALAPYLINDLINMFDRIILLIRSDKETLFSNFKKRNLEIDFDKLEIIDIKTFKMEKMNFNSVKIYHIAWDMDFLKPLSSFVDCIDLSMSLLRTCVNPKSCSFYFISSIGSTLPISNNEIKEDVKYDKLNNIDFCNGYNLSKFLFERILKLYSEKYQLDYKIFRIGQICGDSNVGIWNLNELIPIIINSAYKLKYIPSKLPLDMDWIPVNHVAKLLIEITQRKEFTQTVYHVLNPNFGEFKQIIKELNKEIENLKIVTLNDFINMLKVEREYKSALFSLIDYIESFVDTDFKIEINNIKGTDAYSNFPKLTENLIYKYLNYWKLDKKI